MILIIAEKPSLARNIASAIGKLQRHDGYLEGNGYIVTWAFGHLFSLCDIEDYCENNSGRWTMENLPCFPEKFRFQLRKDDNKQIDAGVKKQFDIITSLCNRADVDKIVNAGDADREGEIIVRLCIINAKTDKEQLRLWLPDQTEQTVQKALGEMKNESEYDNLANEGFARTYIDWLYGVNLTRYATLKTGVLLRVGRVIIPVVKAIYDRDMQIRNFVPDIYYSIKSNASTNEHEIELISKAKFEKNQKNKAEELCNVYNSLSAIVTSKKSKKDIINPGKLYSLSKLQNFLGKKYKMPMEQSLSIVQKLYESGYLTYPRTNSEYLATAEKDKIKTIISNVKNLGYDIEFKDKKTIFDDSKIESHSAITPTYKIPKKEALSEDEFKVYSAVMRRFAAVFCKEDCVAQKTEITVSVGDKEDFVLKGMVIVEPGWTKYDDYTQKDKLLPPLEKGDSVNIDFQPFERETSPPKHYTIETLNNYLKNPFREDKNNASESDEEEYKAMFEGLELGTEATRTGIIDNARKSKYIELNKDVYKILPQGEYLIESLMQMGISMDKYKTSEMGKILKQIFRNNASVEQGIAHAQNEIRSVFEVKNQPIEQDIDTGFYLDKVGKCPLCGKDVLKSRYGYSCTGYKDGCKFSISGVICKRVISKKNAQMLLESGKSSEIQGFISKNGKTFNARLKIEDGAVKFDF